jgi:uncharacterized membrane protein
VSQRIKWVDTIRGLAIALMIIFHFCYDLRYFGYVNWNIPNGDGWWQFRYLILSLFVVTVGFSLALAHYKQYQGQKFLKRFLQLAVAALAITIMSLYLFPKAWIYFGILHFIALASLLGLPLVKYPRVSLGLGATILVGYWSGFFDSAWPFVWIEDWLPEYTEDFVPLFPWLGVMYLGIGTMGLLLDSVIMDKKRKSKKVLPTNPLINGLSKVGKHGLLIYLLHQPIFFAGFISINALMN